MTERERNLLLLLVVMAFLAANFLGYKVWYEPKMVELNSALTKANTKVEANEGKSSLFDLISQDKDWLDRFEPKPSTVGKMKTRIQQLAENEAARAGLVIKTKDFGDDVETPSLNYHRVRYQIQVNGIESSIYRWLDRLHSPNEFRAITFVRLKPQRDDATRADCEVFLDQWFVPEIAEL